MVIQLLVYLCIWIVCNNLFLTSLCLQQQCKSQYRPSRWNLGSRIRYISHNCSTSSHLNVYYNQKHNHMASVLVHFLILTIYFGNDFERRRSIHGDICKLIQRLLCRTTVLAICSTRKFNRHFAFICRKINKIHILNSRVRLMNNYLNI